MKSKTIYIYLAALVVIAIILVVFATGSEDKTSTGMPDDHIHQGTNPPGKGTVSKGAMARLEKLRSEFEKNPGDTAKIKSYADMLNSSHKPTTALELYERILKVDSNRVDILLGVTFALYNLNEFDKAEYFTKKIISLDKDNHEAHFNLGAIEAARGNIDKAKKYWNDVIKNYPNSNAAKIAESSLKKL